MRAQPMIEEGGRTPVVVVVGFRLNFFKNKKKIKLKNEKIFK